MVSERERKLAERLLQERAERSERKAPPRERREDAIGFDVYGVGSWRTIAGPDPGYLPTTRMREGREGFLIHCGACGQEFESKGGVFCPRCAQLPAEERKWMKPVIRGRMCQAPGCENPIPPGTRRGAMYCSSACSKRARREANVRDNRPPLSE